MVEFNQSQWKCFGLNSKRYVVGLLLTPLTPLFHFTQGTFLVGQPAQGSGKQGGSSSAGHAASSPATVTQQAIRVTAGQKAAILAQVSISNTTQGRTLLLPLHCLILTEVFCSNCCYVCAS